MLKIQIGSDIILWSEAKRLALLKWDILRKDPIGGWDLVQMEPELKHLQSFCSFCDTLLHCIGCPLGSDAFGICHDEYQRWRKNQDDIDILVQMADCIWDVINRLTKPKNWPRK